LLSFSPEEKLVSWAFASPFLHSEPASKAFATRWDCRRWFAADAWS